MTPSDEDALKSPRSPRRSTRAVSDHSLGRTLGALVGSLAVALACGLALAAALPLVVGLRYAIGAYAIVPLWAGLACAIFLRRRATHAWLALTALGAAAAAITWVAVRCGGMAGR